MPQTTPVLRSVAELEADWHVLTRSLRQRDSEISHLKECLQNSANKNEQMSSAQQLPQSGQIGDFLTSIRNFQETSALKQTEIDHLEDDIKECSAAISALTEYSTAETTLDFEAVSQRIATLETNRQSGENALASQLEQIQKLQQDIQAAAKRYPLELKNLTNAAKTQRSKLAALETSVQQLEQKFWNLGQTNTQISLALVKANLQNETDAIELQVRASEISVLESQYSDLKANYDEASAIHMKHAQRTSFLTLEYEDCEQRNAAQAQKIATLQAALKKARKIIEDDKKPFWQKLASKS
eukprot:c19092_g1_i4.p1 GENE.c19092_g1_i4~~c19092_g1_i4.p1  ORF type:complete len:299 (+),score=79.17 c19092_g1_i4:95-991(+)